MNYKDEQNLFGMFTSVVENHVWNPHYHSIFETFERLLHANIFVVIGEDFRDRENGSSCFSLQLFCQCGLNPIFVLINRLWHVAHIDYRIFDCNEDFGNAILKEIDYSRSDLIFLLKDFAHLLFSYRKLDQDENIFMNAMVLIPLLLLHNEYHLEFPQKKCLLFPNYIALPPSDLTFKWLIDLLIDNVKI